MFEPKLKIKECSSIAITKVQDSSNTLAFTLKKLQDPFSKSPRNFLEGCSRLNSSQETEDNSFSNLKISTNISISKSKEVSPQMKKNEVFWKRGKSSACCTSLGLSSDNQKETSSTRKTCCRLMTTNEVFSERRVDLVKFPTTKKSQA